MRVLVPKWYYYLLPLPLFLLQPTYRLPPYQPICLGLYPVTTYKEVPRVEAALSTFRHVDDLGLHFDPVVLPSRFLACVIRVQKRRRRKRKGKIIIIKE